MNTLQSNEPNQYLEPEELEFWETADFDDVLKGFGESDFDDEFASNSNLGLYSSRFQ